MKAQKTNKYGFVYLYPDRTSVLPKVITKGIVKPDDERMDEGFFYVSGRVRFASRQVVPAILYLHEYYGYRHLETYVLINEKLFDLGDERLLKYLKKQKFKTFPITCKCDVQFDSRPHFETKLRIRKLTTKEIRAFKKAINEFEKTGLLYTPEPTTEELAEELGRKE